MPNRGSIYDLAKYQGINQQDLNSLFQKMLFERDVHLKVCVNRFPSRLVLSLWTAHQLPQASPRAQQVTFPAFSVQTNRQIFFKKKQEEQCAWEMSELAGRPSALHTCICKAASTAFLKLTGMEQEQ